MGPRFILPVLATLVLVAGCAPRDPLTRHLETFAAESRPVPPAAQDLLSRPDDGPLADTTITCNDQTNICTCISDSDGDCEVKLAALCDDVTGWSDGGVGESCPTADGE